MSIELTPERLARQEERFREAFAKGDVYLARDLYHPDVVYLSPTGRLIGRRSWCMTGIEAALEFIQATIADCRNIAYEAVESAITQGGRSAFVRIHFDWDGEEGHRVRSTYISLYRYRYRDGRIAQQEIYYDPSGVLEDLG